MSISLPIIITGGARAGRSNSSWPFAKLTVQENTLSLQMPSHSDFVFFAGENLTISVEKHALFGLPIGIRIHHQQQDIPQPIVFWYLRTQKLMSILKGTDFAEKLA